MLFRRKKLIEDPNEIRFDAMLDLIKDLPKSDYNRLKDAMDLAWQAYQKVRNVKTAEEKAIEKELGDIEDLEVIEKAIEKEEK